VFTGADLARREAASLIRDGQADPRQVSRQILREGLGCGIVVNGDDRFQGLVTPASLESAANLRAAFVDSVEPARATETLNDVLHRVAQLDVPTPVVDDDGKYLGSVSQRELLQTLDRTR
jgi:glycine betaine/proline transport system ATP-binding protein